MLLLLLQIFFTLGCLDLGRIHKSTPSRTSCFFLEYTTGQESSKAKILSFAPDISDKFVEELNEILIESIRFGSLMLHLSFPKRVVEVMFHLLQDASPRDGGELREMFFQLGILGVQLTNPHTNDNTALYDPECTIEQRDELESYALESQAETEEHRKREGKVGVCLYFDIHRDVFDRMPNLASQLSARVSLRIISIIRKLERDVLDNFIKLREILDRVEGTTHDEPSPMASGDSPDTEDQSRQEEPPRTWEYTDPWIPYWQVTLRGTTTDIPTKLPTRLMVHERRRIFRSLPDVVTNMADDL